MKKFFFALFGFFIIFSQSSLGQVGFFATGQGGSTSSFVGTLGTTSGNSATITAPTSGCYGYGMQYGNVKNGMAVATANPSSNFISGNQWVTPVLSGTPSGKVVTFSYNSTNYKGTTTSCLAGTGWNPKLVLTITGTNNNQVWKIDATTSAVYVPLAYGSVTFNISETRDGTNAVNGSALNNCVSNQAFSSITFGWFNFSAGTTVPTISSETSGLSNNDGTTCSGGTFTLTAPSNATGATFSYSWSPGSAATSAITPTAPTNTATNGSAVTTNYSVTITNTNSMGCTAVTTPNYTVTTYANPVPVPTQTAGPLCAGSSITLTGAPASGSGTYSTHLWSVQSGPSGASNGTIANTALVNTTANTTAYSNGTVRYQYSVTDNRGCTSGNTLTTAGTAIYKITGSAVAANATTCGGNGTITISSLAGGTANAWSYRLHNGTTDAYIGTFSTANPAAVSVAQGTYTAWVSNTTSPNCEVQIGGSLVVGQTPSVPAAPAASPNGVLANVLVGTSTNPVLANGGISATTVSGAFAAANGRIYNTGASGCWRPANTTTSTDAITFNFGSVKQVSGIATQGNPTTTTEFVKRYNVESSLNGTTWTTVTGSPFTGNTNATTVVVNNFSANVTAQYIRVTPLNSSTTDYAVYKAMRIELFGQPCGSGTVNFVTPPALSSATGYRWYSTSSSVTPLSDNTLAYSASFSSNGSLWVSSYHNTALCESARTQVFYTVNPTPSAPVTASPYTGCGSANIDVSVGANGTTCRFYGPNSTTTLAGSGTSLPVTSTGTFTYYVTSYNATTGCESAQVTVTVTVSANTATLTMSNSSYNGAGVSCNGSTNGTVTATYTSPNFPVVYTWSTGTVNTVNSPTTTNTITGLAAGTYGVTVVDNGACTATGTVTLSSPSVITSTLSSTSYGLGFGESCNGASVGAITTSAGGGTGTLTYAWAATSPVYSSTTQNPSGLAAGTYNLTVTDANSCTATNSIVISQPAVITFTPLVGYECSGGTYTSGSITVSASGGASGTYEYRVDGGAYGSSNTFTGLSAGNHTIQVRDASYTTCTSSSSIVNITFPSAGSTVGDCNFVYVTTGGHASNPGTTNCPTTLANALTLASTTSRNHILMQAGTYSYSSTISIPALSGSGIGNGGIVIEGGYDSNWIKSSAAGSTTMNINPPATNNGTVGYYVGIQPASGANGFTLKDLTINVRTGGASGTYNSMGLSIYGIYLSGQTGYLISRCTINTGAGSAGTAGTYSSSAGGGSSGGLGGGANVGATYNGNPVGSSCWSYGCSAGSCGGYAGSAGSGSYGTNAGGGGGSTCTSSGCNIIGCNSSGCNGGAGGNGSTGTNAPAQTGSPGGTGGLLQLYTPVTGATGFNGDGGGGGGGGGSGASGTCCTCGCGGFDAFGGRGGSGGAGGAGGVGGYGGGGSFGVYAWGGSGTITDCEINPGTGGTGGDGAAGHPGAGGSGGSGGHCRGGCDAGCGGTGGSGGTGGVGGKGQTGATGTSQALVQLNSASVGWTGTSVPNNGIVTTNYYRGCTKSQIDITKTTGTWGSFISTDPAFVNDLTSGSSSYTTSSATASIYYPSTTTLGNKNISLTSTTLSNFIKIYGNRLVDPVSSIINSIASPCPAGSISLSTNLSAGQLANITQWDWDITLVSSPGTIVYTSAAAAPGTVPAPSGNWTPGATYQVRLRMKENCCGWSIPVYTTFTISPVLAAASPITQAPVGTVCAGANGVTYSVSAVAGATGYAWIVSGGSIQSGQGTTSITVNWGPAGSASVSVKAVNGCTTATDGPVTTNTFNINALPINVSISAQGGVPTTLCASGSIVLTASAASGGGIGNGSFTYAWSPTANLSASSGTPVTATPPAGPTNYVLVATEGGSGCSASAVETITVQTVPTAGAISGNQSICSGGDPVAFTNATAGTGAGAITYRWENAISPFSSWSTIGGATAATYDPPSGLTVITRYRRITVSTLNSVACESVATSTVEVTVVAQPGDPTAVTQTPASSPVCSGTNVSVSSPTGGNAGLSCVFEYRFQDAGSGSWTAWTTTSTYTTAGFGSGSNAAKIQIRRGSCQSGCTTSPGAFEVTWNVVPALLNSGFRTWTGMISTAWEIDMNWDCGGVPTTSDNVIIPVSVTSGNYPVVANTITGNCRTIRIDGPPSTVTVQTGGTLNVAIP